MTFPDHAPDPGTPSLGPHLCTRQGQRGARFAVWAPQAQALDLCLFDAAGQEQRVPMAPEGNGLWAVFVPNVLAGQLYGLRADGAWQPEAGHRFNPARLLLDPWALAMVGDTSRLALQTGHRCDDPMHPAGSWHEHQPDPHDNAAQMPRCVVVDTVAELAAGRSIAPAPVVPGDRVFIYEGHVKALTRLHPAVPEAQRGTYAGLAHPAVIAHLQNLGITTVCLLPVHQHISERHLLARDLVNHWGYNTLNAFAPEPAYAACTNGQDPRTAQQASAVRAEFRHLVQVLHLAGIEVVLDVVFNHSAESDLDGPTLCWRGLGQADWYALGEHGAPHNFSGCGNSLATTRPRVLQWVMDSLRWWVQAFGVDGFRFDLAVALGRDEALNHAFNPQHPLLTAMAQDPVLRQVRLIAEPWDIGPGGHRTGGFPPGWLEWNDAFRDGIRAFWLGHHACPGELAARVSASSDRFHHHGRTPLASVNLLTAHDGFNLADLTAYAHKHNQANGEDNRDGHDHNLSANGGVEGPTSDTTVLHRRALWRRALLATLLCAQGTPQLLAGDEMGHSQHGNNNAYCQDNALTWLNWPQADGDLVRFVAGLSALRQSHPGLRHARWFQGDTARASEVDIQWRTAAGQPPSQADWQDSSLRTLAAQICVGEAAEAATERLLLVWHSAHSPVSLSLPPGDWQHLLDSAAGRAHPNEPHQPGLSPTVHVTLALLEPSVHLLVQAVSAPRSTEPDAA